MLDEAVRQVKNMGKANDQIVKIDTAVRALRVKFAGKKMPSDVQSHAAAVADNSSRVS